MKKYKVTCLKCSESDVHTFDDNEHKLIYSEKVMLTPLLGVRWRPDMQWGFRCKCGNNNLLAAREADDMNKLVAGDEVTIANIAASLMIPDEKQFEMAVV